MLAGAGAASLLYGALYETERLTGEHKVLKLPRWPKSLHGFRLGCIADLHVRDAETIALSRVSLEWLAEQEIDALVVPGDLISHWKPGTKELLARALEPMEQLQCPKIVSPGNHDYYGGLAEQLEPLLDDVGAVLLTNSSLRAAGINWVGIDSANSGEPNLDHAFGGIDPSLPTIALWHEPDMVDHLSFPAHLMVSGHSHGGQFITPWGWAPMRTHNGAKYLQGFFADTRVPLFVTRGLAVTGPPARLFCRPQVVVLELHSLAS